MTVNVRIALLAATAATLLGTANASAFGVVNVQRSDGTTSTYPGALITFVGKTLHVRSADEKGTMVIERDACSYRGPVVMCLPTRFLLRQNGSERPINLESGTVYLNLTNRTQTLPFSSQRLSGRSILLSVHTQRGTSISVNGTIDSGDFR
jgi:hypothetical protein